MTITVSGLGSGLDYDSWISELVAIKQADIDTVSSKVSNIESKEDTLATLEGYYEDFLTAIEAFTEALSTTDVFNERSVTSSDDAVSATVDSGTDVQDVTVTVSQLATATTAESTSAVASYVTSSSTLSDVSEGAMKAGTFSVYVNGTKTSIDITTDESMSQVLSDLNDIEGVDATLSNDGKLTITSDNTSSYTVTVGSSTDTSNFSKTMALTRNSSTGAYTSSKSLFTTDTTEDITTASFANGTVTTGTFKIGDTEFTIESGDTLDDLIDEINSSSCGATASWNATTGKLELTATDEGATNINIELGSSNFTTIMGLTTSSGSLATGSQSLGTNAIFTINGTTMTSSSNKITSDISGIEGLTLTLNDTTDSDATVSITQDTSDIVTAVTNLVSAYNTAICATDDATATDGDLYGETILKSLRNKIRTLITSSISGEDGYNTLASIGITTGAASTDTTADTTQLDLDTATLISALSKNSDAVKNLLVGNSTTDSVLDKIETVLESATNSSTGYFTTRESSYENQVDRLEDKIEKMTDALEKYQSYLEDKFAAMDELISSLESSASIFDSYFNSSSSD